jgi:hypothetical protein
MLRWMTSVPLDCMRSVSRKGLACGLPDGGQNRARDMFARAQTATRGAPNMQTDVLHKSRSNRELSHSRRRFMMIVRNTLAAAIAAATLLVSYEIAVRR